MMDQRKKIERKESTTIMTELLKVESYTLTSNCLREVTWV